MDGLIEVGFGILFGLLFAYLANNALTTVRAIRSLPLTGLKKFGVFLAHYYLQMFGMLMGFLLIEVYLIWQAGWPDGMVFWGEIMDDMVYGRTSKLFLGFYLAIVLVVVYFRQPSRQAAAAKKN